MIFLRAGGNVVSFPVGAEFRAVFAYEIAYRAAYGHLGSLGAGVCHFIGEDCDRYAAGIGVGGNQRVESLDAYGHRQLAVRQIT